MIDFSNHKATEDGTPIEWGPYRFSVGFKDSPDPSLEAKTYWVFGIVRKDGLLAKVEVNAMGVAERLAVTDLNLKRTFSTNTGGVG